MALDNFDKLKIRLLLNKANHEDIQYIIRLAKAKFQVTCICGFYTTTYTSFIECDCGRMIRVDENGELEIKESE